MVTKTLKFSIFDNKLELKMILFMQWSFDSRRLLDSYLHKYWMMHFEKFKSNVPDH